jgi:hypothetical protein
MTLGIGEYCKGLDRFKKQELLFVVPCLCKIHARPATTYSTAARRDYGRVASLGPLRDLPLIHHKCFESG